MSKLIVLLVVTFLSQIGVSEAEGQFPLIEEHWQARQLQQYSPLMDGFDLDDDEYEAGKSIYSPYGDSSDYEPTINPQPYSPQPQQREQEKPQKRQDNGYSPGQGRKQTKKTKDQSGKSIASKNLEDFKLQTMDYFEKLMNRLSKVENHTEALVIGCGLMLFGIVFVFAGQQSLQALFGVICAMVLTTLMTAFLCILFDVQWDSEMGAALSGVSVLFSVPFVQYALKFSDKFAVPLIAGLSLAAVAEIALNLLKVTDEEPYHLKTVIEAVCLVIGFLIALKIKEYIAIFVTAFFGGFICTMAGSILFDVMPIKHKKFKDGRIAMTNGQLFQVYIPYIISIVIMTILGTVYQSEQIKDQLRIKAQQDQMNKMMNSKPRMTAAQLERSKAKMASAQSTVRGSMKDGKGFKSINDSLQRSGQMASTNDEEQFSGDNSRKIMESKMKFSQGNNSMNDEERQSFLNKF